MTDSDTKDGVGEGGSGVIVSSYSYSRCLLIMKGKQEKEAQKRQKFCSIDF